MTAPDAPIIGLGTTLTITPVSGSAITMLKVQGIKNPTIAGKDVETTGMSDSFDDYIPGVLNAGEAELDVIYLKTQSASLQALVNVPGTTFQFTYVDTRVKSFTGWINSFGEEVEVKDKIKNKIRVRAKTIQTNA